MAGLRLAMGDRTAALEQHRRALAMAESRAAARPGNLVLRRDLADTSEELGRYYETEDRQQARALRVAPHAAGRDARVDGGRQGQRTVS